MRSVLRAAIVLLFALIVPTARAQGWGVVQGMISDAQNGEPLPGVTVVVRGTGYGTATNGRGEYILRVPAGTWVLQFSYVGFKAASDTVAIERDRGLTLNVQLAPAVTELEDIVIEESGAREAGAFELDPAAVQDIPAPFNDAFSALKTMPGVASNNELSNQYSVRGGGYNENLVFVEGFEVYMPFRPRQGEQEGLGLLNPEMASRMTFYTGGFPVRYGGKLASALDVSYRRPDHESLRGSAYMSLLDAGMQASASALDGRLGWNIGARKARGRRFFETQDLKGNYQPDYTDVQGLVSYRLAEGHELSALGIWAEHQFKLDPSSRKTYFGTYSLNPLGGSDLRSLWIHYGEGSGEHDSYATRFGGVRLTNRLGAGWRLEHDASYFETEESEEYSLFGNSILYLVDPTGNPTSGAGHIPTGRVTQGETADNRIQVQVATVQGRLSAQRGKHAAEAGWSARRLAFEDRLNEASTIAGRNEAGQNVSATLDSLTDGAHFNEAQFGGYLQDAVDLLPTADRLVLTGGVRADYFTFNDEWTFSPRATVRFRYGPSTTLLASWGMYYQAPTYRELRGRPTAETGGIQGSLNRNIRSQRSIQYVAGIEQFLPKTRLYLRAELYRKDLTNLISYDVENVRVSYSGRNDSEGYIYGADLQVRGEFVPGLESWANYSYLVARERFLPEFQDKYNMGTLARPSDQRHTFSAFIQDYVPGDRTWRLHLRLLYGSGLPYTPPMPGRQIGSFTEQVPGPRLSRRFEDYKRVDMGITKAVAVTGSRPGTGLRLQMTAELLNVFDMLNTVAYSWVPGANGIWNRVPTRLTPRTFNVRFRFEF